MKPEILTMNTKELIEKLRNMASKPSLSKGDRAICTEAASRLAMLDYSARQMYKQIEKMKAGEKDG